jgi:hypothetical protein
MRSALGLAVENMYAYCSVNVAVPELDDYNKENLEWIRDMEGDVFSTEAANVEINGMTPITLEELGQKLREMDVVVPYGII